MKQSLCNNSGIMNIAMATKTPTIVISCTLKKLWISRGIYDFNFEPRELEQRILRGNLSEIEVLKLLKTIDPKAVVATVMGWNTT